MIKLNDVKEVILRGGLAYPYPRLKKISINGGRGLPAEPLAIKYAQAHIKQKRQGL